MKNYCIICNTLMRTAAEQGGVHPVYLDSVSSDFARRIELSRTVEGVQQMMREMVQSYCRLVKKHSMRNYSSVVQRAITYIDADLSADLSLRTLAAAQNINASYLSSLFKKETGETITEHVNKKRIEHAVHLLQSSKLQVQSIAQHCGISDVNYFSKLFKKHMGMTPREYRTTVSGGL
ncbi:MAG: helix-turn-helix domain-containing protein, partial [Oscillibacter sp.]|nr:helix-turn-helix domain-containing protein [Oscillibacter sp.]